MTYGDIHVHVTASEAGQERVQLAARIASFNAARGLLKQAQVPLLVSH